MTKTTVCGIQTPGILPYGLLLLSLLIGVAQWIGILGLGKVRRDAEWGCMLAGTTFTTVGDFCSLLLMLMVTKDLFVGVIPYNNFTIMGSVGLSSLGSLLFAIGFAIHGKRSANSSQRITELEAIATAQGEELNRQSSTY